MAIKQELLKAKKLLEQHAPKGEFLAYINKDEAQILKNLGGSGKIVEETRRYHQAHKRMGLIKD